MQAGSAEYKLLGIKLGIQGIRSNLQKRKLHLCEHVVHIEDSSSVEKCWVLKDDETCQI